MRRNLNYAFGMAFDPDDCLKFMKTAAIRQIKSPMINIPIWEKSAWIDAITSSGSDPLSKESARLTALVVL